MRTVICKHGPSGHVSPVADSARGPLPDLPPLDRYGVDRRLGRSTAYYRITDVPDATPIAEVVRRLRNTAIWGICEMPYSVLDDGGGEHWRIVTLAARG